MPSIDRLPAGITPGAVDVSKKSAAVNVTSMSGVDTRTDLRVRIKVPSSYLTDTTSELTSLGGIIFPYTPSISYEHKAEYSPINPIHSNFSIYFYKNSAVTPLSIAGKFTVQNDDDARKYLATMHLLRALTKMRFGGEQDSGSPPPVCRLFAYGDFVLDNVPISISSFKNELVTEVEYYYLKDDRTYNSAMVPTVSTISITCMPMYSRTEMQKFTVTGWLGDSSVRKAGYL
jgi:hypothetical protein